MPRNKSSLLNDLSTTDLKRLLAARERIDVLEGEKSLLVKELARIEKELTKLMSGVTGRSPGPRKKAGKKKVAKKKAAKRKVTKKKVAKKTSRKKVKKTVKKAARKITRKKVVRKKSGGVKSRTGKGPGGAKMKLEDVIVAVIKKNRSPVAFQDLKARIVKGKLFKTKSDNFDNVLRRTLSTSKMVKRVGRGIYDLA